MFAPSPHTMLAAVLCAQVAVAATVEPPPVVVMIRVGATAEQQARERKLFDELGFALDDFMLLSQDAERADFARLSLSEQLSAVLPIAESNGASIVVWLAFPLPKQMMLHLVALGSGRALVRTIESDRSAVSESTLALMARELLGTAYLFEPPKEVPLGVRQVVESVKQTIPAPAPAPVPPWALWLRTQLAHPVVGQFDAAPRFELGLAVERRVPLDVDLALSVNTSFASLTRAPMVAVSAWTLGASLTAFRGFKVGAVSLGPLIGAGAAWARFQNATAVANAALPSFELGAQGRSIVSRGVGLSAAVSVGYTPVRAELRSPDSQLLFRTPTLELHLSLSLGWQGL